MSGRLHIFAARKQPLGSHCIGSWVGASAGLDVTENGKIFALPEIEPLFVQSVAISARRLMFILKNYIYKLKTKLRGFSPQANYTDQATAACRRS
jgi:hypothetical protein